MTEAGGIRHLVGLCGTLPSNAAELARVAVRTIVDGPVGVAEKPGLIVAAGPAPALRGLGSSSLCVVAGPLYDRVELARSLERPQDADADSLVGSAYDRWGDDVLAHVVVEASVFVWDCESRSGFVARDPLGASSVFWCRQGGLTAFATELRILLALLPGRPPPDPVGVAHWLRREVSRPDLTLYEGISQLRPGERMRLGERGRSIESYWRLTYEPPEAVSVEDAVELVRPALFRAVRRRLAPEGPTGVLLSGGVDSTSIAGLASELEADVRGYAAIFPQHPEIDESSWIDQMAGLTTMPVVRIAPETNGLLQDAQEFTHRWAAPPDGWGVWGMPLYRRAAIDGARVLLTGDAAEALFDTKHELIGDRFRAGRVLGAIGLARRAPLGFFYPPPRLLAEMLWHEALPATFPRFGSHVRHRLEQRQHPRWLSPEMVRLLDETTGPAAFHELPGPAWFHDSAHRLMVRLPAHGLLQDLRRRGESFGLAVRTPFLDVDLARLALRLPPELGFNGTLTKPLLRGASRGNVPDSIRLRPFKTNWTSLVVGLVSGVDWPAIRALLGDPSAEILQFVRRERLVADMLERVPGPDDSAVWPWANHLLRLAALEVWLREQSGRTL